MSRCADLHIHTYFSDGTLSPQEVVNEALAAGLACISVTDHDTVDGIDAAIDAASGRGLEVIPGIELSSELNGKDIHMLGYFMDHRDPDFLKSLDEIQQVRISRIEQMIEKLRRLVTVKIEVSEVLALTKSKAVGRPHLALILKQKGVVGSIREAFERFLGEGAPAYVPKFKMSPDEAITLVKRYGGAAVFAHPMVTNRDELLPGLVKAGLDGIEVYYPNYPPTSITYYEGIARKHNLVTTGGSDAHGSVKDFTFIGKARVACEHVEALRRRAPKAAT